MMDTYSMHQGYTVPGVVTGKPISLGGSEGRTEATARGTVFCVVEAANHLGIDLRRATVAIQGFGNAGSIAAKLMRQEGSTVLAVSDSTGGIHNPKGLHPEKVLAHKHETGSLEGLRGAESITNDELVLLDCDVLAPCALEQVITPDNADKIKATIICEGANGPVTPAADDILEGNDVLVLPDILANAGGVVVSYFEWVQGLQEYFWKEPEVNSKLRDIVTRAFNETWATREKHATSMRVAAYGLAVERVAEATITRGLYP